jgi:hypothetical protein
MNEVNDEFEKMWKEAVFAKFKILFWNLIIWTEENHGKRQSA